MNPRGSIVRRLILAAVPSRTRAAMEAESRSWMVKCSSCGHEASYWDAGGIRYGARSAGKRIRAACTACGKRGWCEVYRRAA